MTVGGEEDGTASVAAVGTKEEEGEEVMVGESPTSSIEEVLSEQGEGIAMFFFWVSCERRDNVLLVETLVGGRVPIPTYNHS